MNAKVTCIIISCFTLANAGLVAVHSANILEGPSTRTKIIGPDGSIIDAYAPGGKILLDANVGPVLQPAPLVLTQPAIAEPQIYSSDLQQVILSEPVANTVEAAAAAEEIKTDSISIQATVARIAKDDQKVFLQPGTPPKVEARDSVPITEETEESTTTELPSTTEDFGTSTSDLSGDYVPDNLEKLYDDGSYRAEHY